MENTTYRPTSDMTSSGSLPNGNGVRKMVCLDVDGTLVDAVELPR